jgi:hypothetical protein
LSNQLLTKKIDATYELVEGAGGVGMGSGPSVELLVGVGVAIPW